MNILAGLVSGLIFLASLTSINGEAQASVIDYAGNGQIVGSWGPDYSTTTPSFGQIFTAPQSVLNDYSLTISSSNPFPFVSQIYTWNGTDPSYIYHGPGTVGPALYTSAVMQTPAPSGPFPAQTEVFTTYTFAPNIILTVGDQYLYLAIVTNQPDGASLGGTGYGHMELSSASGSYFTFFDAGQGFWYCNICGDYIYGSADFHADFSTGAATPETSTWAMMLSGFAGLGLMAYRRRLLFLRQPRSEL